VACGRCLLLRCIVARDGAHTDSGDSRRECLLGLLTCRAASSAALRTRSACHSNRGCRHGYRPESANDCGRARRLHAACRLSQVACGKPRVLCMARRLIATCIAIDCLATPLESALAEMAGGMHARGEYRGDACVREHACSARGYRSDAIRMRVHPCCMRPWPVLKLSAGADAGGRCAPSRYLSAESLRMRGLEAFQAEPHTSCDTAAWCNCVDHAHRIRFASPTGIALTSCASLAASLGACAHTDKPSGADPRARVPGGATDSWREVAQRAHAHTHLRTVTTARSVGREGGARER
jgi:hypothetical protein